MTKQNLHTHTIYCDGKDTPEEMVLTAIDKGFDSIGFSIHSFMDYFPPFVAQGDMTDDHRREIIRLKEAYKDKISIYLGVEYDFFSEPEFDGYEYAIGSVHFLKLQGEKVSFDEGEKVVEDIIESYFGGDGMKYAKAYYETVAQLPARGRFDILGHFDIVTKHAENRKFFDCESKEYMDAAFEAAHALAGKIPFFEVNTGAIARGYRTTPYPAIPIIKELKRLGFGAVISSDCHRRDMLDCKFDEAAQLLYECGFKEKYILTDAGFTAVKL